MEQHDAILKLLEAIRQNQDRIIDNQEKQLEIAARQLERSNRQVEESLGLQKEGLKKFRMVTFLAVPGILFCILLIVYLLWRYF